MYGGQATTLTGVPCVCLLPFKQATGVYIPVAPLLLEMLQWSELRKTPTGTAAAPDLLMLLRLSKTQLKTSALQEEVLSQVSACV